MTPGRILGAILLAVAVAGSSTWQVQDWRYGKQLAEQAGLRKDELKHISDAAWAQVKI